MTPRNGSRAVWAQGVGVPLGLAPGGLHWHTTKDGTETGGSAGDGLCSAGRRAARRPPALPEGATAAAPNSSGHARTPASPHTRFGVRTAAPHRCTHGPG